MPEFSLRDGLTQVSAESGLGEDDESSREHSQPGPQTLLSAGAASQRVTLLLIAWAGTVQDKVAIKKQQPSTLKKG